MPRISNPKATFLLAHTRFSINELRRYLHTLKKQLEIIAKDYKQYADQESEKIRDAREKDEFYEFSVERHWDYTIAFPRILLNSFHVTAYTFFESEVFSLASRIGRKQKQLFDVSDFPGRDYLKIASFYILKLTGVKAQEFQAWNPIDDGRHIRNIIVHSNGIPSTQHDFDLARRYGFIDESTLEFSSGRAILRLSITYEYCQSFLQTMEEFFTELYSKARKYF
jgi:hypothetical protein